MEPQLCPTWAPRKEMKQEAPALWASRLTKEGQMKEDLKRIIDELSEEDIYLLYVTALEMRRR